MPRGGKRAGAGRKSAWNHSETTVIRVPKIFSGRLLEMARQMDEGGSFECVTETKTAALAEKEQGGSSQIALPVHGVMDLVIDSESDIDPPLDADGGRWVTSKQAHMLAQQRGCDRSLEGFRKWSKRNPEKCKQQLRLRRLPQSRRNTAPSFEDLNFKRI